MRSKPERRIHFERAQAWKASSPQGWRLEKGPVPLFHYMEVMGLLSLLQMERLHFPSIRALQKEDPHEGLGGLLLAAKSRGSWNGSGGRLKSSTPFLKARAIEAAIRGDRTGLRSAGARLLEQNSRVFITSWHGNTSELDFMWRIYGQERFGVAIRTDNHAVIESLVRRGMDPRHIGQGFVLYVESLEEALRYWTRAHYPVCGFMLKSASFRAEHEFRVFIKAREADEGLDLPVDLGVLIQEIRISPLMEPWGRLSLARTLEQILQARGLEIPVVSEGLDFVEPSF